LSEKSILDMSILSGFVRYSHPEVARRMGAHRQSVSPWAAELREKGRVGLKKAVVLDANHV